MKLKLIYRILGLILLVGMQAAISIFFKNDSIVIMVIALIWAVLYFIYIRNMII